MSEHKFVNAYIDTTLASLHEYINANLQLKAQLKVAGDVSIDKDNIIATLTSQIQDLTQKVTSESSHLATLQSQQGEFEAMKSKVAHLDTCLNQIAQMKGDLNQKDAEIAELNSIIVAMQTPALPVEPKKRKKKLLVEEPIAELPLVKDDF